jgi:hypothetical protein
LPGNVRCAAYRIWLQTISGLCTDTGPLALMEFAGEGLISVESSKDKRQFSLASPRSDLWCHHAYINLRNLLAIRLLGRLIFYVA